MEPSFPAQVGGRQEAKVGVGEAKSLFSCFAVAAQPGRQAQMERRQLGAGKCAKRTPCRQSSSKKVHVLQLPEQERRRGGRSVSAHYLQGR